MSWSPRLIRVDRGTEIATLTLGDPMVDDYLEFVGARGRPNTWLATAFDLKVFFLVVAKDPVDVTTADVFAFIKAQREPRLGDRVVRLEDGEPGLSARTIARRLSSVSGLFNYLVDRKDLIQLPVYPFERKWHDFTSAHYMDEFAELHGKDILVREALAG